MADQQVEGLVFTCCKLDFENNPEKLEEEGFAHMQKLGWHVHASRQEHFGRSMRDPPGSSGLRGVRLLNR